MAVRRAPLQRTGPGAALSEVPLPGLLGSVVDGLVQAQDRLDARAQESATRYVETPGGTLAMPPLWYAFRDVQVELAMSARVAEAGTTGGGAPGPSFLCTLVNPTSVSLFGYAASSSLRVTMRLGVMGALPVKGEGEP